MAPSFIALLRIRRLWQQLRITPCSERCANWLLYGVQPKKAHRRLRPGNCKGKAHQKAALGITTNHESAQQVDGDQDQGQPAPVAWEMARP